MPGPAKDRATLDAQGPTKKYSSGLKVDPDREDRKREGVKPPPRQGPPKRTALSGRAWTHEELEKDPDKVLGGGPWNNGEKQRAARLKTGGTSKEMFTADGAYTAERMVLHRAIGRALLQGIDQNDPEPTVMFVSDNDPEGRKDKSVLIDLEAIRGMLPESAGAPNSSLYAEASDIARVVAAHARERRMSMTIRKGSFSAAEANVFTNDDFNVDVGSDVNLAADLLSQGVRVRLSQPREASTLLHELAKRVKEAKALGADAPTYDLCKVTVRNTSLFCSESKGIKRVDIPQLSGVPLPGSPGDKLEKDKKGAIDLAPAFRKMLEKRGIKVTNEDEKASHLRASQIELNGAKVASMTEYLDSGGKLGGGDGRIFVSEDNYIVDGHHRWAANVGQDLSDGNLGDIDMPVARVQMSIIELLDEANRYAKEMGIPQAGVEQMQTGNPLPEQGSKYFNTSTAGLKAKYGNVNVQEVDLDKIQPVRARPEGIANAKPLMIKAGQGTGGKRDPITLIRQPGGGYRVYDGNSTYAIAKEAGWGKIPAIVVDNEAEAARIEGVAKDAKAARKIRELRHGQTVEQKDGIKIERDKDTGKYVVHGNGYRTVGLSLQDAINQAAKLSKPKAKVAA